MSSDADTPVDAGATSVGDLCAQVQAPRQEVSDLRETTDGDGQESMTVIATKGILDMAYPPSILASTAAAFGWDVVVFHMFWGLDVLREKKSKNLKLSAVGSPSIPMSNAMAALPFMDSVATDIMEKRIQKSGTTTVEELIETSLGMGIDLQACQMTVELMGYNEAELYDGITTGVGAATTLQHTTDADIRLMI